MCLKIIYIYYMNQHDLALNNLQELICHKTQPTKFLLHKIINARKTWKLRIYLQIIGVK